MRRLIAIILVLTMLTGCSAQTVTDANSNASVTEVETVNFEKLNDPALLDYVEETVYSDLIYQLNSEDYLVENVQAIYISKEYIDELTYNSLSNVYFGYTLAELDAFFKDTRYVFTLGEDGKTTVQPFESYDESYERMVKNVAIGTGVILVCVTVSIVSRAAGAAAVSMVFAASAKTGTVCALSSGLISGVASGVTTGIETKDFEAALKAAAVDGSEGFKWGAIGGTLTGGLEKTTALYGATRNGLTMNQAAIIQQESKLPLEFIKNFHSVDEYNALKNAGLSLSKVNGKMALIQKIDWDFIGDAEDGLTNAQRVMKGLSPLDSTGSPYELHHIGQMSDSPLAILTNAQHKGNYSILHANTGGSASNIDRTLFEKQKREFWKALLELSKGGA